jgi:hypothetical protein
MTIRRSWANAWFAAWRSSPPHDLRRSSGRHNRLQPVKNVEAPGHGLSLLFHSADCAVESTQRCKLDDVTLRLLEDHPLDVGSWEVAVASAHGLDWDPLPCAELQRSPSALSLDADALRSPAGPAIAHGLLTSRCNRRQEETHQTDGEHGVQEPPADQSPCVRSSPDLRAP